MVKSLMVSPQERMAPTALRRARIMVNQYAGNIATELRPGGLLTPQTAARVYTDMRLCRGLEQALLSIKTGRTFKIEGRDQLPEFMYGGPAHLRVGEEANAVGGVFFLRPEDLFFGTHASHEPTFAKGLSAIHQLDSAEGLGRLADYHGGELTSIAADDGIVVPDVLKALGIIDESKDHSIASFLYGLAAEIFCKQTGFNRGLGGSMHVFFLPFGIGPNNAIVGSSANISAGAAYAELVKNFMAEKGKFDFNRVMFMIGDGAAARGPVGETLNFMGMAQIASLWGLGVSGLPLIGHFVDNVYGMGGQTVGETASYDRLVRRFYGEREDGYHAESVNGNDPLAVMDFYRRKFELLGRTGGWPLGAVSETYRQTGHSPSDQSAYREDGEVKAWKAPDVDPMTRYRSQLVSAMGPDVEAQLDQIDRYVDERVYRAMQLAVDPQISPPFGADGKASVTLAGLMFKKGTTPAVPCKVGRDIKIPLAEHPHYQRVKTIYDKDPALVTYRDALALTIMQQAAADARFVSCGEDIREWGGPFAAYRDLHTMLPHHRHFNAPISEGTIIGWAVGAALNGLRPLVEIMYSDFIPCGSEELVNQLAKWRAMSAGEISVPGGVRVSVGSQYGAQHSQDLISMLYGIPGLYLGCPATPYDAKAMLTALLKQDNPFVLSESQKDYGRTTQQLLEKFGLKVDAPTFEQEGCIIGQPQVVREGRDLTLLAFGTALYTAAEAAKRFEELGVSTEVINARWLVPFDYTAVVDSLKKTGKMILVGEATERGSYMTSIASTIARLAFDRQDGPIGVVGSKNTIASGWSAQQFFFPSVSDVLDEFHWNIRALNGYSPVTNRTPEALLANLAMGV
ncbi:MAG: thiamine pyrophosphate-dependent enzyme [Candidatus Margulisiibacteriota bacterium]